MFRLTYLLVVAVVVASLGSFVWRARPTDAANRWFALFALSCATWSIGLAGLLLGSYGDMPLRIIFASGSIATTAFFAFCYYYPNSGATLSIPILRAVIIAGFLLAAISLFTPFIAYDARPTEDGFERKAGFLYLPFAAFIIGSSGSGVLLLHHKSRRTTGLVRLQLQYVLAGALFLLFGSLTTNLILPLVTGRSTYSLLGPLFLPPFVLFVAHAIIRHRLMDLRLAIHRSLISAVAALVSVLPIVVFLMIYWNPVFAKYERDYIFLLLVTLILAALAVSPLNTLTSTLLNRYAYRTQTNFQLTVRSASRRLTQILDLRPLLSFVAQTIVNSIEPEGVAIYLARGYQYARVSVSVREPARSFRATELGEAAIFRELSARRELILHDDTVRQSSHWPIEVRLALAANNWALVLPLLSEDVLIGAIVVGPKMSGDPFYPDDLDLLMTLANQAGIAIKNSQLFTQVVLANEYIQNIVATIESGVIAVDAEGCVTMFNPAAEQLTGVTTVRATTSRLNQLPELAALIAATLADGRQRTVPEMPLPSVDVTRPVICTTSALRDPSGNILGAVAVFSDLTPFKQLENERRRAERLAYFEILASSLAHEIKNPLVAIKTFAQLLPRRHGDEQFVVEFSRVVTREIGRMERLVDRLRALSRPSDRPKQSIDLREPLDQAIVVLRPAFEEKSIILNVALGDEPRLVIGDPHELEQLFINLLMNAHEATPPEGNVSVVLTASAEATVVEIADSGTGIPSEMLDHVFDPFVSSKPRGSGLGLTVSSGIAAVHRATLRATNRPDGGALFVVEFPLSIQAGGKTEISDAEKNQRT